MYIALGFSSSHSIVFNHLDSRVCFCWDVSTDGGGEAG